METSGASFLEVALDGREQKWINLNLIAQITKDDKHSLNPRILIELVTGEKIEVTSERDREILLDWLSKREIGP